MVEGVVVYNATQDQATIIAQAHHTGMAMIHEAIKRLHAAKKNPDALLAKYFGVKSVGSEEGIIDEVKDAAFEKLKVNWSDALVGQLSDKYVLDFLIHSFSKIQRDYPGTGYWLHHTQLGYITQIQCNFVLAKTNYLASTRKHSQELYRAIDIVWPLYRDLQPKRQAEVLVHEQAHFCDPKVIDEAYVWEKDKFAGLSQVQCLHNAESYSEFALACYNQATQSPTK